jgi:predicted RNase H-like nuclease (RuvC/YqgF family)
VGEGEKDGALKNCLETVHRLEEENVHLRRAAGEFGQLAERLNSALREERRVASDRRQDSRARSDRRQS